MLGPVPSRALPPSDDEAEPEVPPVTREISAEVATKALKRAADLHAKTQERLRAEDLFKAGEGAGIPAEVVAAALKECEAEERARQKEIADRELERQNNRAARILRLRRYAGTAVRWSLFWGFLSALAFGAISTCGYFEHGELQGEVTQIQTLRTNVRRVLPEYEATLAQWASRPASPERTQALLEAGNTLHVAVHAYDAQAAYYNSRVTWYGGTFARKYSMPSTMPLSTAIRTW